jgi:TRAP-type C4-dicarboxylate transport system permease small subunit
VIVKKFADLTERALKAFTATLLVAMVTVILLQVTFRYALNLSLAWTEEVGRYLFVWICLFGASLAYRYGQHSGYETVVAALPAAAGRWLTAAVDALVAIFSIVLIVSSRELIEAGMGQLTPATELRIAYVYFAFPLSAVATLIFVADALRKRRTADPTPPAALG